MTAEQIFFLIECVGVVAYAVSAAIIAIDKKTDIFGVLFLTLMTTFGGGITRDLLLGNTPPLVFRNRSYWILVLIASVTAFVVFLVAYIFQDKFVKHEEKVNAIDNVFDALALGVFATSGATVAMEFYPNNWFLVLTLAMLTATGGGIIRDVMLGEIPLVLRKRIYAIAALSGGAVFYLMVQLHIPANVGILAGTLTTFVLRMCATYFKWNLPKAIK